MSRVTDRQGFDDATRLRLMESDLDSMDARWDRLDKKMDRILGALLAVLVAVCSSSVILVIQR